MTRNPVAAHGPAAAAAGGNRLWQKKLGVQTQADMVRKKDRPHFNRFYFGSQCTV
jgi:hypothetical protein